MDFFQLSLIPCAEIDAVHYDLTGLRLCQANNVAQQRALAGPAPSEQDHRFSPRDVQADSVQHTPVVVTNDYVANRNGGIIHRSVASGEIEKRRKTNIRKDHQKSGFGDSGSRGTADSIRAAANPESFKTSDVHDDGRECKTL